MEDLEQLQGLNSLLPRTPSGASQATCEDPVEAMRKIAELHNRTPGDLTGYDCPLCLNRGYRMEITDDGSRVNRECSCMTIRRNRERIARSGLADLMQRYTFETWQTPEPWQKELLTAAKGFAAQPSGWFAVLGAVGCGKTHICTAICGELLNRGYDTRYMLWREVIGRIKALVNEPELYKQALQPYLSAKVLYIDDLFKVGKGQEPTSADFNVAFELLNHRYINSELVTLISSELSIGQIMEYDEAVGSRIYELAKRGGCYFPLGDKANWRLRG